MNKILVIGGTNIDYLAKSISPLVKHDSNIGDINISSGGVGRNIAINLALLRNKVSFITGLSNNMYSKNAKKELKKYGIKVIVPKTDYGIGSYVAINDNLGEMNLAICDNKFCDNLNYSDIEKFSRVIDKCDDIVIDTNLNEDLIKDIIKNNPNKKYYVDGVSTSKVIRLKNVLSSIYLFKSNLIEAQKLMDTNISGEELVLLILNKGSKNVVITNSSKEIYYGSNNKVYSTPATKINPSEIINVNGAGDAFFAGLLTSMISNNELNKSIKRAKKMSYYTLKSSSSFNENIFKLVGSEVNLL